MDGRAVNPSGVPRDDRANILGVSVNSINLDDAVATIERWISERSQNYVCVTSVHGVMEGGSNERLRR